MLRQAWAVSRAGAHQVKPRAGQRDSQLPRLLRALAGALVLLGVVLLWPVRAPAAESLTTLACVGAAPYGGWAHAGYSACEQEGGTVTEIGLDVIDGGTLVPVCSGGSGVGVCASVGGDAGWQYASTVTSETLVYIGTLFEGSYEYANTVSGWPGMSGGGGGDDDGDDEGGDQAELVDFMQSGRAFAAAFILCAVFWGMGRGVGLIVGLFSRH